jgi:hypothetical protein
MTLLEDFRVRFPNKPPINCRITIYFTQSSSAVLMERFQHRLLSQPFLLIKEDLRAYFNFKSSRFAHQMPNHIPNSVRCQIA